MTFNIPATRYTRRIRIWLGHKCSTPAGARSFGFVLQGPGYHRISILCTKRLENGKFTLNHEEV
jgi:hypothetical protein